MRRILCMLLLLPAAMTAAGQDIHFSQFYETAVLRNPALTGIFSDDYKVGAVYRSQWNTLGKPFQTGMISAEGHWPVSKNGSDYVSIGLLGYYDKAGRVGLKTTAVYPAVNYNKSLEDAHFSYLSVGFTGGYVQRSFDVSRMTFDNQYQNGVVIPAMGAGEQLPDPQLQHWDIGAGVSFNSGIGPDNNVTYFVGVAAFHFTRPRRSFYENGATLNLQTRWNGNLGVNCMLNDIWSLQVHLNYMQQGPYRETIGGGLIKYAPANNRNDKIFALSGGLFYRHRDAIVPMLKIEYKHQTFGLSYDINVSSLKAATNLRGGLELTAFINGMFNGGYDDKHGCPRF